MVDAVAICLISACAATAAFNLGGVHGERGEHTPHPAHYRAGLALLGPADTLPPRGSAMARG